MMRNNKVIEATLRFLQNGTFNKPDN